MFFVILYNTEFVSMPVLPLTDNLQKCLMPPDCLLGVVTQPTDIHLNETIIDCAVYYFKWTQEYFSNKVINAKSAEL